MKLSKLLVTLMSVCAVSVSAGAMADDAGTVFSVGVGDMQVHGSGNSQTSPALLLSVDTITSDNLAFGANINGNSDLSNSVNEEQANVYVGRRYDVGSVAITPALEVGYDKIGFAAESGNLPVGGGPIGANAGAGAGGSYSIPASTGYSAEHVALGANVHTVLQSGLVLTGGAFVGKPFDASSDNNGNLYTSANAGFGFAVGSGMVKVEYDFTELPVTSNNNLVVSTVGVSYSMLF